jgi:hypothetical protein
MSSAKCAALVYYFGRLLSDSAQSTEERNDLEELLKAYKWALKVNSEAGASFARQSIFLIQASEEVSLLESNSQPSMTSPFAADDVLSHNTSPMYQPATSHEQLPQHSLSSDQTPPAHMFLTGQNPDNVSLTGDWMCNANASIGSWDDESCEGRLYEFPQ